MTDDNKFQLCRISIQVEVLDEAHKLLPNASWWLKGDGCDVITSLEESVGKEWNGDVDFGDGSCQEMHEEYLNHLEEVSRLKGNVFNLHEKQAISDT